MIKVTRLNDAELVVNAELIEFVEASPETIICLTTGKKVMVRETIDQIIERVAAFKRMTRVREAIPDTDAAAQGANHG